MRVTAFPVYQRRSGGNFHGRREPVDKPTPRREGGKRERRLCSPGRRDMLRMAQFSQSDGACFARRRAGPARGAPLPSFN